MVGHYLTSIWIFILGFAFLEAIQLTAYISEYGLHGTISFIQTNEDDKISIETNLRPTLEFTSQIWSWYITEFPTDYSQIENRCNSEKLGKQIISLHDELGYLIIPDNNTSIFTSDLLTINGKMGIYGKSLQLVNVETNKQVCASIINVDKSVEKISIATFNTPISGDVYFRWLSTKPSMNEIQIMTDLYHINNVEQYSKRTPYTEHIWKIYVTDILESESERVKNNCNILQLVFDQENNSKGNATGDIDVRIGKVKVSTDYNKNQYKVLFADDKLSFPTIITGPRRSLYLVIFESKHEDRMLSCAKIQVVNSINSKVVIDSGGIKGEVLLSQHSKFDPTFLNFNLSTARGDLETKYVYSSSVSGYKIHELPIKQEKTVGQNNNNACLTTKYIYNPMNIDLNQIPPNGFGTQDQYAVGDLSGKLLGRNNKTELVKSSQELNGKYWDTNLPLIGKHSIIHRSLVLYKNTKSTDSELISEPWVCGSVSLYEANYLQPKQIFTAQIIFRYPLVGRILFRQLKDEPWADTTMIVEYLVHADGSTMNNSMSHRWAIHDNPPGKDFYNWTARCLSAGNMYNPYKVDINNSISVEGCNPNTFRTCRLGDLSSIYGTLDVSGKKINSDKISRKLYTILLLPLSGIYSVLGRSFVIYDDFGPKARGERLACSIIGGIYRRKAVARDWFPNGDALTVKGKIEIYQQTEYDITNVDVDLEGLEDNSGYHVHITPIEENLQFPCEYSTLYDHWNPLNVDPALSPKRYIGTQDQYEIGDLSGKFGTLDNYTTYKTTYNDTTLPLFGPRSILGRSIVIHKKNKNRRWVCSTIERGYSPSEARELRAIASFHNPAGFAYGYLKMTQLIYNDGSQSDTIIQVKLRHPGNQDRNVTRDHNWAIFVNPVGVDATVPSQSTRCVAGGYVWNPFFTQLADPLNQDLYNQECGPENPLRCHVGDLSSRLGTIDIGLQRAVFTDSNFPLEGSVTALGRSIVIMSPNKGAQKYACANIEPDHDIIKYTNIEKPPRFVLSQFIEEVRRVMGIPEWMLTIDTRKTKTLHSNACIQFLMHFKGPIAKTLDRDFSRLLATGRLEAPSLYIPGYIDAKRKANISYKQCGVKDPNEEKKSKHNIFGFTSNSNTLKHNLNISILLFVILIFLNI